MSKKVIVIAGTTGVGKSQLSIQLAQKFNGEVINSDSMQVYKDIPIITNKHPLQEREGIPHHVMNHVDWSEEYYSHRFETECMNAIEDIHRRGKIPIVVGVLIIICRLFSISGSIRNHPNVSSQGSSSIFWNRLTLMWFITHL